MRLSVLFSAVLMTSFCFSQATAMEEMNCSCDPFMMAMCSQSGGCVSDCMMDDCMMMPHYMEMMKAANVAVQGSELMVNAQRLALWQPWRSVHDRLYDQTFITRDGSYLGQCGSRRSSFEFWADGYYRSENVYSSGNVSGYDATRTGVLVGADKKLSSWALAGFTFGYGQPKASNDFCRVAADDYTFGLYSKFKVVRELRAHAFLGYGNQTYYCRRAGMADEMKYGGDTMYASLEFYRPFQFVNGVEAMPLFAVDYQKSWTDGCTDNGGMFPMTMNASQFEQLFLRVGLNSKYEMSNRFSLRSRLQYGVRVAGDDQPDATVSFVAVPGASRMLTGTDVGRNVFNAGLGGDWYLSSTKRTRLFADYDLDLGERAIAHTAQAGFVAVW